MGSEALWELTFQISSVLQGNKHVIQVWSNMRASKIQFSFKVSLIFKYKAYFTVYFPNTCVFENVILLVHT